MNILDKVISLFPRQSSSSISPSISITEAAVNNQNSDNPKPMKPCCEKRYEKLLQISKQFADLHKVTPCLTESIYLGVHEHNKKLQKAEQLDIKRLNFHAHPKNQNNIVNLDPCTGLHHKHDNQKSKFEEFVKKSPEWNWYKTKMDDINNMLKDWQTEAQKTIEVVAAKYPFLDNKEARVYEGIKAVDKKN